MERQSGETPAVLLAARAPPDGATHVAGWFQILSAKRTFGMAPNPISEQEIGWFFKNRGITPLFWEIQAIELMDNSWLMQKSEAGKAPEGKPK